MGYISNADIELRLGSAVYVQLTDDAGTGEANEELVSEMRLGAEGEMDSYLGRRYTAPVDLESHPELAGAIKSIALDLVEYRLQARQGFAPAEVQAKHDAAVRWLQKVAEGEAVLPSGEVLAANPAVDFMGRAVGHERVLTHEGMEDL